MTKIKRHDVHDLPTLLQFLRQERNTQIREGVGAIQDVEGIGKTKAREKFVACSLDKLPLANADAAVNFAYGQFMAYDEVLGIVKRLLEAK